MSSAHPCGSAEPSVSAVIPTKNRPGLVVRAVSSALTQTFTDLEVIVVIDGPDPETESALAQIHDHRLRVLSLPTSRGGGGARNAGVECAHGQWIAFLDDDDEWMADKLTTQLQAARSSAYRYPIISSRIVVKASGAEYIWPRRLPGKLEPIAEYLFSRGGVFQGEGVLSTDTLLAPKELLQHVPFRALKKHQDWDWVLRAMAERGTGVEFCDAPLAIWHMDEQRPRISNHDDWRFSFTWAHSMRPYMTPRAYASFLLIVVAGQAYGSSCAEYFTILLDALHRGRPSALHLALFAGMITIPRDIRRRLRAMLTGRPK